MTLFKWVWCVLSKREARQPRIVPRHTDHNERNLYPGLAWSSPIRQGRMAEMAARKAGV